MAGVGGLIVGEYFVGDVSIRVNGCLYNVITGVIIGCGFGCGVQFTFLLLLCILFGELAGEHIAFGVVVRENLQLTSLIVA